METLPELAPIARINPGGGGLLDISLGGEVRLSPSYPDPV